jgi:hypothetical protein
MKFYETTFDDYLQETKHIPFHPELSDFENKLPNDPNHMGNLIVYGPCGTGKYTQSLRYIQKYSPSHLKYEKKMILNSDKYNYSYKISDIHYEIDMGLLGCNAKLIWHELFLQIVDIISVSPNKMGIILCKNFHKIHTELLPLFYSYIQQYNSVLLPFQIKYIIISEHISFIPNNIIQSAYVVNIGRPINNIYDYLKKPNEIDKTNIQNLKEVRTISKVDNLEEIPEEYFDIICDSIIQTMVHPKKLSLFDFREKLYDILVYNLDFTEVLWHILVHFINEGQINSESLNIITKDIYSQLKQYNNNYRPIYHLEIILLNILNHIHGYNNTEMSSNIQLKRRTNKSRSAT